jgi:phosphotriesterase-related protein
MRDAALTDTDAHGDDRDGARADRERSAGADAHARARVRHRSRAGGERVAQQVDLNIVLATGVFTTNELPQYFHYRHMLRPPEQGDVLVELFVRDIREGIKGTDGAKAAILKCAIDTPGLMADVERVLRATAVAHRETGVPITTHTDAASRGGLMPVDDRIAMVLELCERGWADRLTLSQDADTFNVLFAPEWAKQTHPRWRYELIPLEVLPELRERGMPEETIRTMMVDTPRRLLDHPGGY